MKLAATILLMLLLPTLALAQPLPVPKAPGPGGSCGHGLDGERKLLFAHR